MDVRHLLMVLAAGGAVVACLASARPSSAADLTYGTVTSTPEGLAVCSVRGTITDADEGTILDATLTPASGEGLLVLTVRRGAANFGGAGVQPGCDIFPDAPGSFSLPVAPSSKKVKFSGSLNLHAHPGSDCDSPSVAEGTVTLLVPFPAKLKKPTIKCDHDPEHANLRLIAGSLHNAIRGKRLTGLVVVTNLGPGDATGVELEVKLPKSFFPTDASSTQGTCTRDFKKHRVKCALGTLPFFGQSTAQVDLEMIPLKQGRAKTTELVSGENNGKIFERKDTVETDVAKGSSSILTVTMKCKGAAGTVTINPNGTGGVTTCTCPDPADATKDEVVCIEVYDQKTTIALTPAATTGQFDKWKGACAGNPAACSVTVDPAAQNPDANTTAKFK